MSTLTVCKAPAERKNLDVTKIVDGVVFASFAASVLWLIYQIAMYGRGGPSGNDDYLLMLMQCSVGMLVIRLPDFVCKKLGIGMPVALKLIFSGFLFCAIFLGEVFNFYYLIPHWDDVLHFTSGVMSGFLGCMLIGVFNKSQGGNLKLSPIFIAVFSFCFALTVGAVWEVYEFAFDGLLGLNMQKTMLQGGELLSGRVAVTDTMIDLIVDSCGALLASFLIHFSLKRQKGWVCGYTQEADRAIPEASVDTELNAA